MKFEELNGYVTLLIMQRCDVNSMLRLSGTNKRFNQLMGSTTKLMEKIKLKISTTKWNQDKHKYEQISLADLNIFCDIIMNSEVERKHKKLEYVYGSYIPYEIDDKLDDYKIDIMEKLSQTVTDFEYYLKQTYQGNNLARTMFAMQNVEKFEFVSFSIDNDFVEIDLEVKKLEALNFNFMRNLKHLKIQYFSADVLQLFRECRNLDTFVYRNDDSDDESDNHSEYQWKNIVNFIAQQKKLEYLELRVDFTFGEEDLIFPMFKLKTFKMCNGSYEGASFKFLAQQDQLEFLTVIARMNDLLRFHEELKMIFAMPKLKDLELQFGDESYSATFPKWFLDNLQNKTIKKLHLHIPPKEFIAPIVNSLRAVEEIILYGGICSVDLSEMPWNIINKIYARPHQRLGIYYAPTNILNPEQIENNIIDCFEKGRWKKLKQLCIGNSEWPENPHNFQLSFKFCKYLIDLVDNLKIDKLYLHSVHDCNELQALRSTLKPSTLSKIKFHYKLQVKKRKPRKKVHYRPFNLS